jgi:hypothetical protein
MHDLTDHEAIVGIIPRRVVRVDALVADEIGLRMYYSASPPYPRVQLGVPAPEDMWRLLEWRYEVTDDLGTSYVGGEEQGRVQGWPAGPVLRLLSAAEAGESGFRGPSVGLKGRFRRSSEGQVG